MKTKSICSAFFAVIAVFLTAATALPFATLAHSRPGGWTVEADCRAAEFGILPARRADYGRTLETRV